jgi:hypothetical protein
MRSVTAPGRPGLPGPPGLSDHRAWDRWVWGVSGLVTACVIAILGFRFIVTTGSAHQGQQQGGQQFTATRTVTVAEPVTSVIVQSYGASIQVTGARVSHPEVTESFGVAAPGDSAPPIAATVRDGLLSVGSAACATSEDCSNFVVTVPRDVTIEVASQSGPVTVTGVASVTGDSGGGSMNLSDIDGPVNVTTDSGPLQLTQISGPVQVDTGGGFLNASDITAATATIGTDSGPAQLTGSIGKLYVETGGGSADITLSTTPQTVTINSDSGPAVLAVPGGPYAVFADSDGGPESVNVPVAATAPRSITITTGGGSLEIDR